MANIPQRIKDLMSSSSYLNMAHPDHDKTNKKVSEYFRETYPGIATFDETGKMNSKKTAPFVFEIPANKFLKEKNIQGYYHEEYTPYDASNPHPIHILKNKDNAWSQKQLENAMNKISDILIEDIPVVMQMENVSNCVCINVPRSKKLTSYSPNDLMFTQAIRQAISHIKGVADCTDAIRRTKDTRTTYLANFYSPENKGDFPYPGITKATCQIDVDKISGKTIILVDDVYAIGKNIDEDCIQALYDNGAARVIFYSVANQGKK